MVENRNAFEMELGDDSYFIALGKLMQDFAGIETMLQLTLWKVAGMPGETAKALFRGMRQKEIRAAIHRVMDAKSVTRSMILDRAFSQIEVISNARNDIVHYGAQFSKNEIVVSNIISAHLPQNVRNTTITVQMLTDMSFDLGVVTCAILVFWDEWDRPNGPGPGKGWVERANAPWLYKQPPQAPPQSQIRPSQKGLF